MKCVNVNVIALGNNISNTIAEEQSSKMFHKNKFVRL